MKKLIVLIASLFSLSDCWKTSNYLTQWYNPWELCIFSNTSKVAPQSVLDDCIEKLNIKGGRPYFNECNIGGMKQRGICATKNHPFSSKPHLQMSYSDELDDPQVKYLHQFTNIFNKLKGTVIAFGDSQLTAFRIGLKCENLRRNARVSISMPPNSNSYTLFFKPEESINLLTNYFNQLYKEHDHIFILINLGIHYNQKSDGMHHHQNSHQHFLNNYPIVLNWMNEITKHKNKTVAWIETFPQHYPTPNGYFEFGLNVSGGCSPIPSKSTEIDWRNEEIRRYMKNHSLDSIHYVSTYEIFAPLYKEHYNEDCTHYCWSPMIYQPIFKQMYEILQLDIQNKAINLNIISTASGK